MLQNRYGMRLNRLTSVIRYARTSAVFGVLSVCAPMVAAQPASDDESAVRLQSVVVEGKVSTREMAGPDSYQAPRANTATRFDLTPRETPQSLSVISRAQLEDFSLTSAVDALESTPGISVERVETDRVYFTARGFDVINFQYDGLGVPMVYKHLQGDIDTAIYERIEVLRGANGLLSGTGNPSATVNFIRKRPTREAQASLTAGIGSWDKRRLEADVAGPLDAAGKLRGRLVAAAENRDSYLDRLEREDRTVYGVLELDLTDSTLLSAGHSWQQTQTDSQLWGALPLYYSDGSPTNYDVSTSSAPQWAFWNNTENRSFIELVHGLESGWEAKAALNYIEFDSDAAMLYQYGNPDRDTGLGLFSYPSLYDQQIRQWIADAHLKGPFALGGREHELMVGAQWSRSTTSDRSQYGEDIGTPMPPLEQWDGNYSRPGFTGGVDGSDWVDRHTGIYSAARLSLTDHLHGIVGARLSRFDGDGLTYGLSQDTTYTEVITPYAGLIFDLTDQLSLYASYTEIFQPQTETDINRRRLEAIEGVQYEAGVKAELFNGRADGTLAVFRIEQDNLAEANGTVPGTVDTAYIATEGITSEGFEATLAGEVAPNLQASFGYTYVDIRDAENERARTFIPKHMVRATTTYRLPFLPAMKVGANVSWQESIYRDQGAGVTTRQDDYALLDVMASYEINENLNASLNLNNVTDEKYLTSLYWAQGFYGAPRHAMFTLGWKY